MRPMNPAKHAWRERYGAAIWFLPIHATQDTQNAVAGSSVRFLAYCLLSSICLSYASSICVAMPLLAVLAVLAVLTTQQEAAAS